LNGLAILAVHAFADAESKRGQRKLQRSRFRLKPKKTKRLAASNGSIRQALNC
jgi:hypothetical protein